MNKKCVLSIALSMAVNCMTQTSSGLNITLEVLRVYCKTYRKNRWYRIMVHANLRTSIQSRISPSYHNNNKLGLVFEVFFFYVQLNYCLKVKLAVDCSNEVCFAIIDIDIDTFVGCNWVDTRWQLYSTRLHTNST
jgi:hypothetical protein